MLEKLLRVVKARHETIHALLRHLAQQRLIARERLQKTNGVNRVFGAEELRNPRLIQLDARGGHAGATAQHRENGLAILRAGRDDLVRHVVRADDRLR